MGCMSDMAVVLQERGTVYPCREHGLYEWHGSCLTRERNCLPLAGTLAVWVTWQLSYKREELFTLGGNMGCMSDMAVVLQERGTAYHWRAHGLYEWHGSCLTRERNCLPLAGTWAVWVTWQLSYMREELFTLGGHMGCMSDMAAVLPERETAYPWRAHGLYKWHGSCLTWEKNCLPLTGTWAVWVTWQLSYKRGELLTLGGIWAVWVTWQLSYKREELLTLDGHMGCMSDMAVVLQERGTVYPWRAHGLYEWHGSCLTRKGNCLPLAGTWAVWVTWQLSYKREELFTLGGHMGCMSEMAVVLQEMNCLPLAGTWAVRVTWPLSYKKEELFTLAGNMGCMNDMPVVLQQRGTAFPWRAHGLYEWHGSCLTRKRNCLPLPGTWAVWVTWQLSYKRGNCLPLAGTRAVWVT